MGKTSSLSSSTYVSLAMRSWSVPEYADIYMTVVHTDESGDRKIITIKHLIAPESMPAKVQVVNRMSIDSILVRMAQPNKVKRKAVHDMRGDCRACMGAHSHSGSARLSMGHISIHTIRTDRQEYDRS